MTSSSTPSAGPGTACGNLTRFVRSASFRLTAAYAAIFCISAGLLFAVIFWIASDALHRQAADAVVQESEAIAQDWAQGGTTALVATVERRVASTSRDDLHYLMLDGSGTRLAGDLPPLAPQPGWFDVPLPAEDTTAPDELQADPAERHLTGLGTRLADGSYLFVGYDNFRIVEAQEAITRAFAWAIGVTLVLALVGGTLVSLRFLSRIDTINRTMGAIMQGALSDRVPTRGTGDELDDLALGLNRMLDRIQSLMESLRQVSSDIAHDLRTPLGRLRQRLEAAQASARTLDDYDAAVSEAIAQTETILDTFSALLRIAQIEAGARRRAIVPVDLSEICANLAEAYAAVAEDRGQTLSTAIEPGVLARGDRDLMVQMIVNLVENAIRHGGRDTTIRLAIRRQDGSAVIEVSDTGPGIPAGEREHVFRRFYRLDASRSEDGSGLGLALVKAVCDLHGATIELDDNRPGLQVVIRFDAAERSEA